MRPPAPPDKTVALHFYEGILAEMSARVTQRAEQFRGCARIGELYVKQVGHDETCPARGRGNDTTDCDCLCAQIPNADPTNLAGHLLEARVWIKKYKAEREQTEKAHRAEAGRLEAALKHYADALEKARGSIAAVQGHETGCEADMDPLDGSCACFFTTGAAGVTGLGEVAANALAKLKVQAQREKRPEPAAVPVVGEASARSIDMPGDIDSRMGLIRAACARMGIDADRVVFWWDTDLISTPFAAVSITLPDGKIVTIRDSASTRPGAFGGLWSRVGAVEGRYRDARRTTAGVNPYPYAFLQYLQESRSEAVGFQSEIDAIDRAMARLGLTSEQYTVSWSDAADPPYVVAEMRFPEFDEPATLRLTAFTTSIPTLKDAFATMISELGAYGSSIENGRRHRSRETALWDAFERLLPVLTPSPKGFTPRLCAAFPHTEIERYPALWEIGRRAGQLQLRDADVSLTYSTDMQRPFAEIRLQFTEFNKPVVIRRTRLSTAASLDELRIDFTEAVQEYVTSTRGGLARVDALLRGFHAHLSPGTVSTTKETA